MSGSRIGVLAELVRAPAALSVPGDVIAGAAASGWRYGRATPAMAVSSICFYWAGMALNDYADRELDAVERPERPIPSGRIAPGTALAVAVGLTATGLAISGVAGGRKAMTVAVPLAGVVWAYDLVLKQTPAGPAAMAAARGLNVLMGAGAGGRRTAGRPALNVALHTYCLTQLSRHEVDGGPAWLPRATLAGSAVVGAAAALYSKARWTERVAATGFAALYLGTWGPSQVAAAADPTARNVRRSVAAGIHALLPLQAALTAARSPLAALPLAGTLPLARKLSRRISPT